jgi:lipid-binding SYLF domain-containing protein
MNTQFSGIKSLLVSLVAVASLAGPHAAVAAQSTRLEQDARGALKSLYARSPVAKSLGNKAHGILIFPKVTKAGFIVGGQGGDGVLLMKNKVVDRYETAAVSVGLQAGAQSFGYVLFFMSDAVLKEFRDSSGFEIGVGPNIVVIDAGAAKDINTLTAKSDVYAMIFDQKGLMAGVGLQGSKITKVSH